MHPRESAPATRLECARRRASPCLALGLAALLVAGCGSGSGSGGVPQPRSYRMGFFLVSPEPTVESVLATAEAMAEVSDVVFWQESVPWTRLLVDGETLDEIAADKVAQVAYLESLGLEVAYLVDPLNGLNRREEAPELTAPPIEGSLLDPDFRALHEEWVRTVARTMQPRWLGLASEINTPGQHGDALGDPYDLYDELVDMIGGLVPEVNALSPDTQVFVSFQVEDAHGLIVPGDGPGFDLLADFVGLDALGLSSYPLFQFETPADVPDDHLSRFREETDLPLLLVESGWSSESVAFGDADPAEQAAWVRRYAELLDGVDARMWINLLYADLDAESYGLPPDEESTLLNFARMGIADEDLAPKPAFAAWRRTFARPLETAAD